MARRVAGAEKFYARYGSAARFQISPGASPGGLDTFLAERGYRREGPSSLRGALTAQVLRQAPADSPRVRLEDRPTSAWFEVWHAVNGGDVRSRRELLDRVDRPSAYACAVSGDDVIAVGRAVADAGWAGVFSMATVARARGRGAARAVLAALAGWADTREAERMYLQVERDNAPALRLYDRAGFGEVCRYHYRTTS